MNDGSHSRARACKRLRNLSLVESQRMHPQNFAVVGHDHDPPYIDVMSFNMHQHHTMICGVVNDPGTGGQSQRNKWSTCAVQMVNLARNIHRALVIIQHRQKSINGFSFVGLVLSKLLLQE